MQSSIPSPPRSSSSTIVTTTLGNVLIGVYFDTPDAASLRELGAEHSRLVEKHPKGVGVLSFCASEVRLPDAEARAALVELARVNKAHTLATAVVLPGTGFWLSAARSMIDGATRAFGSARSPQTTFDAIQPAATWLVQTMGGRASTTPLLVRAAQDLVRSTGLDESGRKSAKQSS